MNIYFSSINQIKNYRKNTNKQRTKSVTNHRNDKATSSLLSANAYYNIQNMKLAFSGVKKVENESKSDAILRSRYEGCLLGGAIGDAYGAPVEFMKLKRIKKLFGEKGLTKLIANNKYGGIRFTDDTQLTLFTADGLLRSAVKDGKVSYPPDYDTMFASYRNWYKVCCQNKDVKNGWISKIKGLRGEKCSGKTIMSTLSQAKKGSLSHPINQSKSCGGVMRSAPIGLMYNKNPEEAFDVAVNATALTHGHPISYLAAGVYAAMIANLVNGESIYDSITNSMQILRKQEHSEELCEIIDKAIDLAFNDQIEPQVAMKELGHGWDADEAVAMAVYASLKTPNNYEQVLINSINHDGDSDTVASIAGGIVGTALGIEKIPSHLRKKVAMERVIIDVARDLFNAPGSIKKAEKKYPKIENEFVPDEDTDNLKKNIDCDNINVFEEKRESMSLPLYFRYIDKNYSASTSEEVEFSKALDEFVAGDSIESFLSKSEKMDKAYSRIKFKILSNEDGLKDMKLFFFCRLIEALDTAQSSDVATKLSYYLYDDFASSFNVSDDIKFAKQVYMNTNLLKRESVKESLIFSDNL